MILLTGGTGFVGRNLIRELSKGPRKIRCLVRDIEKAAWLKEAGCELARGDIRDPSSVLGAITPDVDLVIHLVGILFETKTSTFKAIHTEGTRSVVNACRLKGVRRYLHMSALGTRQGARSEYHRTKWEAEEIVRNSGLDYTIFRPSVIFGREDSFTNLFARIIRSSPVLMVPGSGKNRMQPVFIGDVVKAFVESISDKDTINKTFELAGPEVYAFDGIMDEIASALGKKRIKIHVPLPIMRIGAAVLEKALPKPPITRDQLLMLEEDNITMENALVKVFGVKPRGFREGIREYLG